jgi:dUTPase
MRKFEVVTIYKNQNIQIPKRATEGSAGYDLACASETSIKSSRGKKKRKWRIILWQSFQ